MGIRGLSSYFSNRESFFQTVSLENSEIVIDGNNLRYSLFKDCPATNHAFGGDYDKYYRYVKSYFSTLLKCGIKPTVVFDGGYDASDIKIRTVMLRTKDQIRSAVSCNPVNQHKVQVYPLLGKEVFLQVLFDLNIVCIQTEFEADQIIAEMGMQKKCPVLSNDSDFFVFSVDFVRLDSVDLHRSNTEGKLVCELFDREKFLSYYKLANPDMLHLLASLIGNDYIPPSVFDTIFSSIKLPKKTKHNTERHRRIKGLIMWLAKEIHVNSAIDRLLGCFQEKERKNLKEKVLRSMSVYSGKSEPPGDALYSLLPSSLAEEFSKCRLPNWIMDIVSRKKIILQSQVECSEKPSVHSQCYPLLQTIVSLLNSSQNEVILQSRIKNTVGNMYTFNDPHIVIEELTQEERRDLMTSMLYSPVPESVPDHLLGLLLVFNYWSTKENVSPAQVYALLLCRFILKYVDPKTNFARSEKKIKQELENPKTSSNKRDYLNTMSKYVAFFHTEESLKSSSPKFDRSTVHGLSMLQSIFYFVSVSNRLLGNVITLPRIEELINGTFYYNMTAYIEKKPEAIQSCHLPLAEKENFLTELNILLENLKHLTVPGAKRGSRKKKTKPKEDKASEVADDVDYAQSGSESEFFDVQNKFSALALSG